MKHLSIRLPWHDRGWDGRVCNNPSKNSYCKGFHSVNAERIRGIKNDSIEETIKGQPCNELKEYCPPCTETLNVFGTGVVKHTHIPKSFILNTSPKTVDIIPNSSGTWPFEDMWDEWGERREADERKENVEGFFKEIEEAGKAGLIFYYCNYDNPVSGDDRKYLLAGIARLNKIYPFTVWDDIPEDQKELYGGYIWSILVENNPAERIRLPYQEYIEMGKDPRSVAIFAEGDLSRSFKYVAHHVSDDDAISLIDKTIVSTKTIIKQKFLPQKEIDYWQEKLTWLQSIRKECWISRGLYPGLSSVLKYLGMAKPEEFIRIQLKDINPNEIKDYLFNRLEGRETIIPDHYPFLSAPKARYEAMLNSGNENEVTKARICKDRFPFFDLDADQVENILGDRRETFSIRSSLQTIYANPYSVAEEYAGSDITDFINFEKIDHGMLPSDDLGDVSRIKLDDPRRLRCLMHTVLTNASGEGHTYLEWSTLVENIVQWHEQNDKAENFHFDLTTWNQHKDIFSSKVVEDRAEGINSIYLKHLHDAERKIRTDFNSLIREEGIKSAGTNWEKIIESNKIKPNLEQIEALEKLYTSRLSVLTGTAGTGKTTVIRSLVQGIKKSDPRHDFLLLAPTGKATLILRDRLNDPDVSVMTIHSFLMRKGWINRNNFTLKVSGGQKSQVATLIVDECSMIEVMLFATMLRAIDIDNIERIILVGDNNQLPPIGPGKIFFDLIKYLKGDSSLIERHLAELHFNWRQALGSKSSVLASHFAKVAEIPDEGIFTEIVSGVYDIQNPNNKSDLIIDYWKDDGDLIKKIPSILEYAITRLEHEPSTESLGVRYNNVHGIPSLRTPKIEAINVIAPYRHTPTGVDNINLEIQKVLRGKETVDRWSRYGFVHCDKVLQVRNFTYYAFDHTINETKCSDENYIPNGTLGFFLPNRKKKFLIKFPKEYERYSYYPTKKQANEMLELGYATSVHKAQGSQFDITIMILPDEDSSFLNREMLYTALTRSTKIQIILIQNDFKILKSRLWLGHSDIVKRNSSLFTMSRGISSKDFDKYKPENLIYEVLPDLFVRSKGERIISEALIKNEIGFYYEKPLLAKDNKSFKLPDFTFKYKRKEYYWEHEGMKNDFDYSLRSEKKRRWYHENGYQDNLIVTPIEGMNLNQSIKYVLENILNINS